jgi:CheY-like chemotaxis protein
MPVCDGLQSTTRIRELEKTGKIRGNIPIIAMTAHAMPGDGERCINAGMNFYVTKPLNAKVLQELLSSIAETRSSDEKSS